MEPNMFVDRIDELLKKQGKKRPDLYSNLNIPKNLIGQWKQRGTIPSADVAVKIAEYLGTSVEYLVTGKKPPIAERIPADLQEVINKYAEEP